MIRARKSHERNYDEVGKRFFLDFQNIFFFLRQRGGDWRWGELLSSSAACVMRTCHARAPKEMHIPHTVFEGAEATSSSCVKPRPARYITNPVFLQTCLSAGLGVSAHPCV
jgi:hypothetical protein